MDRVIVQINSILLNILSVLDLASQMPKISLPVKTIKWMITPRCSKSQADLRLWPVLSVKTTKGSMQAVDMWQSLQDHLHWSDTCQSESWVLVPPVEREDVRHHFWFFYSEE